MGGLIVRSRSLPLTPAEAGAQIVWLYAWMRERWVWLVWR